MGTKQLHEFKHKTGTEVAPQSTAQLTEQPARKPDAAAIENIFHHLAFDSYNCQGQWKKFACGK